MKKKLKALLSALLCASMLCGCAGEKTESPAENSSISESGSSISVSTTSSSPFCVTSPAEQSEPESGTESPSDSTSSSTAESQTSANSAGTTASSTPDQTSSTSGEPVEDASSAAQSTPSDFTVAWNATNQWEEGGKTCVGYEVSITNSTGSDVSGWTVTVGGLPQDFKITASWNGLFTISGSTLQVVNESYNGDLKNGGNAGFGFNCSFTGDFTPSDIRVNGTQAGSSFGDNTHGSNDGNTQGSGDNNSQAQTTGTTAQTAPPAPDDPEGTTPVAAHGQLSVKGSQLIDMNGNAYQLRGMSTHGITWFPDFVNENAFRTLRDDWNTNVVRMAMYVDEWGNGQCYMQNKDGSRKLLDKGVDLCIQLGMYVIIDWHVLNPGDPNSYTDAAIEFFDSVSKKYADYPNIIYEIVNEPNGDVSWSGKIKPYAEKVIPVIRKNDSDAVIIVGTPTWSQDIDQALADPLDEENVMYALHFYAATHTDWLRERAEKCAKSGLPIFVSEFGCCDASGNGANDFGQTEKWLSLLDKYGISYCNWNLANKDESSSCFKSSAKADGNWSDSDYSQSGAWIRNWFRNH